MRGSSLHRDGGWCIQTRDKFLKYLAKYFKYLAKFEKLEAAVSILDCLMVYTRLAVNPLDSHNISIQTRNDDNLKHSGCNRYTEE